MLSCTSSIADQHIAVSKHTAKLLNEEANISENNIEVIYNFVDREKYNKSQLALIQSDLGDDIKQDAFTVGYGGRLERRKGWRSVIRAARENSEIQFIMCGSGTGSSTVMQKAEKIDNLHYVGFLEDIRMLFSNIDCLLLPSHWDPSPMILYEAQSCGLPVVCTDVQSINELVGQKDALIYQSKNQDALSDRLHELQQNPELRKSLANRSIQNSEKYTFERFQSSIEDTYSSIYTDKSLKSES
jgi:Glycosyltransferase